jgi:putative DNA primase/helicase
VLRGTLQLAKPLRLVEADVFDADPLLLNVRNGTLDLRTGELRPHCREDMCTRLAPVDFDASAPAPLFEAFLARIFAGDQEVIGFLQRFLGYCLTGSVEEQVMGVFHGTGANGKSTLLGLLVALLGDYAQQLSPTFLLATKYPAHQEEQERLRGHRLACAIETPAGERFNEALVKHLTGGDRISARGIRAHRVEFNPTHKLILAANDKPEVRGMDEAIWRRLLLVPFGVEIPAEERDPRLREKLIAEAPGILAWLVAGCLEWRSGGLRPPSTVMAASADYRLEMDTVGRFLEAECVRGPGFFVKKGQLRTAYEDWCRHEGAEPLGARAWAKQLAAMEFGSGATADHDKHRTWTGVALRARDCPQGSAYAD